jgi:hypothetical protein
MNKTNHTPLSRLVAAARRAPLDSADASAPIGFATRVVARAGLSPHPPGFGAGLERLAARMLGLAAVFAVATVLWTGLSGLGEVRASSATDADLDPVGVILEAVGS